MMELRYKLFFTPLDPPTRRWCHPDIRIKEGDLSFDTIHPDEITLNVAHRKSPGNGASQFIAVKRECSPMSETFCP